MASAAYRWYLASQVLSLFGTMMGYTALFWLALHIRYGGAPTLAAGPPDVHARPGRAG